MLDSNKTLEYRRLGNSGLKVPALSFGTATFGGRAGYEAWGTSDVKDARAIVDACLEAGVTMFDTANSYSEGRAEEILGEALGRRRDQALIATKASGMMGDGPWDGGSSRLHLLRAVDESLRRLGTDHVDILYMHLFDATTAVEEVVGTLDDLVSSGKVRYVGASNFAGWQLMKSLAIADRHGRSRYVAHQVQYSLAVRHYEYELRQLGADQGVGTVVWSPLAMSTLTGKMRRGGTVPDESRLAKGALEEVPADIEKIYDIVEVLSEISAETGRTPSQIAINWLLREPTVSSVVIGARTVDQLRENLGAVGWNLTAEQVHRLDEVSTIIPTYPYFHQLQYPELSLQGRPRWINPARPES